VKAARRTKISVPTKIWRKFWLTEILPVIKAPTKISVDKKKLGKTSDDLAEVAFGEELASLAGLPVPLQPRGLGFVHRWHQQDGLTHDLLLGVFRSVMARKNRPPIPDWSYFDRAVCDTLAAAKVHPPAAASPQPAARPEPLPRSDAEKAAAAAVEKARAEVSRTTGPLLDWYVRHQTGARPPLTATVLAHCEAGLRDRAYRWLAVMGAARNADEPCLELPPFDAWMGDPAAFEARMLGCEEALTAPEDRQDE
jgi:hypothetical protein